MNTVTADWYHDPLERFELRYHDGQRWTSHVSSGGIQITDPEPVGSPPDPVQAPAGVSPEASTEPAPLGEVPSTLTEDKRRQATFVMLGCAAAMVLGMFLPWATSRTGDLSGIDAGVGWVTGICGIGLALYARQGLGSDAVRYHPGALTAMVVAFLLAALISSALEDLNTATLGVGDIEMGSGLWLTALAPLVAIWPLGVFWRDYRQRRDAMRAAIVDSGRATQAAVTPPSSRPPSDS